MDWYSHPKLLTLKLTKLIVKQPVRLRFGHPIPSGIFVFSDPDSNYNRRHGRTMWAPASEAVSAKDRGPLPIEQNRRKEETESNSWGNGP